jgi:CRP-like cAMP-binding protein
MVQLNKYTDQKNLPPTTKAKLKNNYDYMFCKRFFNEREILKTVSASLRQQILIHNTRQLVENSPFFDNLPSFLIMKIISALSVELYLESDVIYTLGEVAKSVFFITSGSVAYYSPSGKEVCHFSDGDYFGEMTLVSDRHYAKAIALETTECYK